MLEVLNDVGFKKIDVKITLNSDFNIGYFKTNVVKNLQHRF